MHTNLVEKGEGELLRLVQDMTACMSFPSKNGLTAPSQDMTV